MYKFRFGDIHVPDSIDDVERSLFNAFTCTKLKQERFHGGVQKYPNTFNCIIKRTDFRSYHTYS